MREQLIKFKTAKLAKKKGFNTPCYTWYNPNGVCLSKMSEPEEEGFAVTISDLLNETIPEGGFLCPTQSLLQKWLREKYKIIVTVGTCGSLNTCHYEIWTPEQEKIDDVWIDTTYEKALEIGLQKALNLITL